ncbi:MAG: alpha/beta hydrolase [Pontibacterium sp.]
MPEYAAPLVVGPKDNAQAVVIWLHGLGAHGSDFIDAIAPLGLPEDIRFILPHAPQAPVTINGGWVMPSWYDILSASPTRLIDEGSLKESVAYVHQLIEAQLDTGIPAERIFIFGFSQGGALAYQSAMTFDQPLGGLVTLSTYIPLIERFDEVLSASVQSEALPVWIGHGRQDDVVPMSLGEDAYQCLVANGLTPQWQTYDMGHSLCLEQLTDLGRWMKQQLPS